MMQKNHGYLNIRHMIEFVISKYKEDISWVNQIKKSKVTIYDKSDENSSYIKLPNVGREAHTYLYHIIKNYNNLQEFTCFLQGHPFDHTNVLSLYEIENFKFNKNDHFIGLTNPGKCDLNGNPHHPYLDIDKLIFTKFFIDQPVEITNFNNMGPTNVIKWFPGAQFIVHKDLILNRKIELYEDLLKEFDRIDIPCIGYDGTNKMPWVMERVWWYIFNPNFKTKYDVSW